MFRLNKQDDGSYRIAQVVGDLVIESSDKNAYANFYIKQAVDSSLDTQRWFINRESDGRYSFRNKGNGLYLDVVNANYVNGTELQCCPGNGSVKAQRFNLEKKRLNSQPV
jgi:hypothetical protein